MIHATVVTIYINGGYKIIKSNSISVRMQRKIQLLILILMGHLVLLHTSISLQDKMSLSLLTRVKFHCLRLRL